jgi:hypothetical protein
MGAGYTSFEETHMHLIKQAPCPQGEVYSESRFGYCRCGCGEKTALPKKTNRLIGRIAGLPLLYRHGHNRRKSPLEYKAADRGYATPCWIWQRTINDHGYGIGYDGTDNVPAHVLCWERIHGKVPDGTELDHLCRVRSCVNPDHVEAVLHVINVQRGSSAKLTPEQVIEIRNLQKSGMTLAELGKRYGVSYQNIGYIWKRVTWKNLGAEK